MRPKLTDEQLEKAVDLQRKCLTHQKIAEEIGVRRETITRVLGRYNRKVSDRLMSKSIRERARQFERLDWIIEEAAEEWHRSKLDAETVKVTNEGLVADDKTETTTKGQTGDPRYLSEIRSALADQRKILGLDAPTKTEMQIGGLSREEQDDLDLVVREEAEASGVDSPGDPDGLPA